MPNLKSAALGLAALFALSACGGGDGSGTAAVYTPDSALFTASAAPATLTVLGLNRSTGNTFVQTTNLTPPSTLSGGLLTGTVSYSYETGATNSIALSSGKTASLEDNGNQYAFRFGNADMIGVAGVLASAMPGSGTATYEGFADVIANDGTATPKVLTNATTTADFGTNRVNVYLNNAGGDWIRISDAAISGNSFSSGNMTVSSTFATDPVTSGGLQHEGRFFEQNAKEVGGVFMLDRTGAGIDFKAQGAYGGTNGS